jgi:hypothetical protein
MDKTQSWLDSLGGVFSSGKSVVDALQGKRDEAQDPISAPDSFLSKRNLLMIGGFVFAGLLVAFLAKKLIR